jgi:hypothetical protein
MVGRVNEEPGFREFFALLVFVHPPKELDARSGHRAKMLKFRTISDNDQRSSGRWAHVIPDAQREIDALMRHKAAED